MNKRLLVSFSGGETSARMALLIHTQWANRYDRIVTIFANTGRENEKTLRFVDRCDKTFGWDVVWVEAVVAPEHGQGTTHRVTSFDCAQRLGQPFEEVIAKFGIPNSHFLHCTRELKLRPITSYVRSIGWSAGSYDTAIGIRDDEVDRIDPHARKRRFIYPLISTWPHRKPDVNEFWARQDWRLDLKGYEGNCITCHKKSLRKLLTLGCENPAAFEWNARMEREHAFSGAGQGPRRFFRGGMQTIDLLKLASEGKFEPAEDDARVYQTDLLSGMSLDEANGCSESCDVDFGEDLEVFA